MMNSTVQEANSFMVSVRKDEKHQGEISILLMDVTKCPLCGKQFREGVAQIFLNKQKAEALCEILERQINKLEEMGS